MSNNHFDIEQQLSSELQAIQPPDALHHSIRSRILKEGNPNRSLKSKKKVYLALSFTVLVLLVFGGGFVSPTFAEILKSIPVIGIIYDNFDSDIGLKEAKNKGLTDKYEKTVTSNNVELTITNTYWDGETLSFGYKLINKGVDVWKLPKKQGCKCNYLVSQYPNKIGINGNIVGIAWSEDYQIKGTKDYEGVVTLYPSQPPKGDFTLTINLTQIAGIQGKWDFNISISKDKTREYVQSFSHKYKVNAFSGEFIVKNIDFTPTGITLDTETIMDKGKGINYYFSIVGVGPDRGPSGHTKDLGNGKELVTNHFPFPPMKEIPKSVTIMVYNSTDTSQKVKFTIPLAQDGTVKDSDKNGITTLQPTYVKVDTEGKPEAKSSKFSSTGKMTFPTANGLTNTLVIEDSNITGTAQRYFDYHKQKMKYSVKGRVVPVSDVDLSKFPQLKEYNGMLKMEGTETTEYYANRTYEWNNEKRIEEIFIYMVPGSTKEDLMKIIDRLAQHDYQYDLINKIQSK